MTKAGPSASPAAPEESKPPIPEKKTPPAEPQVSPAPEKTDPVPKSNSIPKEEVVEPVVGKKLNSVETPKGNSTQGVKGENNNVSKEPPKDSSSSSKSITTSNVDHSNNQTSLTFISPRDRLFGLSSEVHTFSTGLLEKTSDGILKAAKIGDLPALKQLHEKGYSLLSIDATGQTALHLASRYGHKDIVRYLIACAPPTILNIVDNDKGQTALHKAAQHKRRSICCMLVAGGATLTVKDRHGNTPRQLALIAEDRDLAAYLQSQEQFQIVTEEDNLL